MIDNIDLKAMRMLIDLNETRNTYVTAERLDLSQSAVARMLSKCRTALNDPIFVRASGKLQPTSFAEHLLSRLPNIISEIDDAISANQKFEPVQLNGRDGVIYPKEDAHPVPGILVGTAVRVIEVETINVVSDGRC